MGSNQHSEHQGRRACGIASHNRFARGLFGRWFLANSILSGLLALLWLMFRSGAKPSRLAYPCQRAAIGTAFLAFGAPLVAVLLAVRRRLTLWMRTPAIVASAALGLAATVCLSAYLPRAAEYSGPILQPPLTYRAQLFHVTGCPQAPAGDHFVGLSNLLATMGRGGLKFYRSSTETPVAGSGGIIARHDVVVIKINYQWDQRGGTNTDLLRGLIRAIVDHPDGFTGEVIVCENSQYVSIGGFDRPQNNAQDHALSPHDVVVGFQQQGYPVSHYDWASIRTIQVGEYSAGNMTDGYIVEPYNATWHGKLSYAKFRTAAGAYVSIRYGIWDPGSATYDHTRLKFINVPVLKSHNGAYGATASTKNYMGVVTDQFSTGSHAGVQYGMMGALMGEIQMADLNIVDAIWINANPNSGPQTSYEGATRRDELVASLDPIALDIWSVKNILIPGFLSNGYRPPWPAPSADPDLPTSAFRTYLDNSMNQLLAAGHEVTNNYDQIDVSSANGASGDFDGNGTVDTADYNRLVACFTGPGGGPVGPECAAGDFDGDGDIDCDDWRLFRTVWTSSDQLAQFPACDVSDEPGGAHIFARLHQNFPNPFNPSTTLRFDLPAAGNARLAVYDVAGHLLHTLLDVELPAGSHEAVWDGRDSAGRAVASGAYFARLQAGGKVQTVRMLLAR